MRTAEGAIEQHHRWVRELLAATRDSQRFRVQAGAEIVEDDELVGGGLMTEVIQLQLHAAVDNLAAAGLLRKAMAADDVIPLYSPTTAARGSLEPAVIAWWLMRPDEPRDRVARLLSFKLQDAFDEYTFNGGLKGLDHEEQKARLFAIAGEVGVSKTSLKAGFSTTRVIADFDREFGTPISNIWQLSSGVAHGRRWAVRLTSVEEVAFSTELGRDVLRIMPNPDLLLGFQLEAGMVLDHAVERWNALSGAEAERELPRLPAAGHAEGDGPGSAAADSPDISDGGEA